MDIRDNHFLVYAFYLLLTLLLIGSVFLVPYLAFSRDMNGAYKAFAFTCHQKISRSECLFKDSSHIWFGDCTSQNGKYISSPDDRTTIRMESDGVVGYKLPVCARDVGIYLGLLIGAILFPLGWDLKKTRVFPPIFLFLAITPLAIDGTVQLLSDLAILPFIYESTNLIRLGTGLLAGIVASIYLIQIILVMVSKKEDPKLKS